MPILEAEQRLREGGVPDNQLYDLVLLATGSRRAAEAAFEARIAARLDAGQKVGQG